MSKMEDLNRLKKKRTSLRAATTKLLNKIETSIDSSDIEVLEIRLNQLNDKFDNLKQLNYDVEKLLDLGDLELDIDNSEEYQESLLMWKCKLSRKIKELNSNFHSVVTNTNVRDVEKEVKNGNNDNKTIKLPKLSINKFHGDSSYWLEFYNQFESAVNNNTTLSNVDKFNYLKSLLSGNAAAAVSGFALTNENYNAALDLLKSRFGRKDILISSHMGNLLNISPVKYSNDLNGLRKLHDKAEIQIRSLESLGIVSETYGNLLCPIILKLLPHDLTLEFSRESTDENLSLQELLSFLDKEIRSRERANAIHKVEMKTPMSYEKHKYIVRNNSWSNKVPHKSTAHELVASVRENECLFCRDKNHKSDFCESLSIDEKRNILRKQGRCFLCLLPKHQLKNCYSKQTCAICHRKHNRAICFQSQNQTHIIAENGTLDTDVKVVSAVSHCHSKTNLLQTCAAKIVNGKNSEFVRILMDNGSQRTFIQQDLSRELKLPVVREESLSVFSFGSKFPIEKIFNVVKVKLENKNDPNYDIEIEALETEHISTVNLPPPDINIRNICKRFKELQLADLSENDPKNIELLIGVDYYFNVVTGRIKRLSDTLVATETIFGWCILGQTVNSCESTLSMNVFVDNNIISDQLRQFWELENLGVESESSYTNIDENGVKENFESTVRFNEGKYKVRLPWKSNVKHLLEDNYEIAIDRFQKLTRKFRHDPPLFLQYKQVLNDYLTEGIIERVVDTSTNEPVYYLPHRAVIREDRTTSKLRIVFDASSHAKNKLSLNDCLHIGPNLYPNIFDLLINFRENPIAFTADIKQAFLQIQIDEKDRDVTRFFWTDKPFVESQLPEVYRFTRVLFGLNSSPFLLAAAIKYHLEKYVSLFPDTTQLLDKSLYVDDVIGGRKNIKDAFDTCMECIQIFKEAGMTLHKFQTNSKELYSLWMKAGIPLETNTDPFMQQALPFKVLGIAWNAEYDYFYFDNEHLEKFLSKKADSKRFLLQVAGRIFDPVGFLSPYTIRVKCLIQDVWQTGLEWDEELPEHLKRLWEKWCDDIKELNSFVIPRYYLCNKDNDNIEKIELHCFSDSSQRAYGTVTYLRTIFTNGNIHTCFVASKSRVAPLKTLSLPRLELMGALLSARLSQRIIKALQYKLSCYFWTDSTIVYFWIRGSSHRFKPFVKNRVEEIQKCTEPSSWFHCPGKDNPADLVSRGLSVKELRNSSLWWYGPPWLCQPSEFWPSREEEPVEENKLEYRRQQTVNQFECVTTIPKDLIDIEKFNNLQKVLRITAWIMRFISNAKKQTDFKTEFLTANELKKAGEFWIRCTQNKYYSREILLLEKDKPLPKNSKIYSLAPFLDNTKILRITGRLSESKYSLDEKHPVIIPYESKFGELLVHREHGKVLHGGVSSTLAQIRSEYWIPKGRQLVKKVINRCLICRKYSAKPANQITAQLPRDRISETPVFNTCGVDFAGPIYIKDRQETKKSYIALFTCAVTRALHLELVSDMSTRNFMLAFRRFISRRGTCHTVYSDNAKTFKRANEELRHFSKILETKDFQDFISTKGITWKFIVEYAPWWGGFYERLVKSVKTILRKILGKAFLTFEEMTTILTEVEAVLNTRPLTYVFNNSDEPEPLAPVHFLHFGRKDFDYPLNLIELQSKVCTKESLIRRKQYQVRLLKQLWLKWKEQYLLDLKTAHHLKTPLVQSDLKINDVVLVEGTCKSKLLWDLGIIKEVFCGRDGHIRACIVKTNKGDFRKPIQLLYPLEITETD